MQITRLDPTIPLSTPKGNGLAHFYIWLGEEHHALWVVCQDATGEWWTWENPEVRGTKNITFGRTEISKILVDTLSPHQQEDKVSLNHDLFNYSDNTIDLGGC